MTMTEEAEAQSQSAFKSSVEDLALEELTRLQDERKIIADQLTEVDGAIKTVKAILRAATVGGTPGPKPKKQPTSAFSMSEEREGEIIRWLTGNEDEITSKTVKAKFSGWSDSYCNMALKWLRETGVIRLAATAGSMNIYRSMI